MDPESVHSVLYDFLLDAQGWEQSDLNRIEPLHHLTT